MTISNNDEVLFDHIYVHLYFEMTTLTLVPTRLSFSVRTKPSFEGQCARPRRVHTLCVLSRRCTPLPEDPLITGKLGTSSCLAALLSEEPITCTTNQVTRVL